jgi:hypothetical protein
MFNILELIMEIMPNYPTNIKAENWMEAHFWSRVCILPLSKKYIFKILKNYIHISTLLYSRKVLWKNRCFLWTMQERLKKHREKAYFSIKLYFYTSHTKSYFERLREHMACEDVYVTFYLEYFKISNVLNIHFK